MLQNRVLGFLLLFSVLTGCFTIENRYTGMAPGLWRATLDLSELSGAPVLVELEEPLYNFEDTPPNTLPFNFEIIYENETDFYLEIINGEERIPVRDIHIGRDRRTNRDTFLIEFPLYESYIRGIFMGRVMQGEWVVTTRKNYALPFVAKFGKGYRFTQLRKEPSIDLSGKWAVQFEDRDETFAGIGEFEQENNELRGTFRTETGDYRYLEGTIQNDKLYLSVFDGAHAFLFEAKVLEDNTLLGLFKSGKHYQATWIAKRDEEATLASPESLTYLKEGYETMEFAFENPQGKVISMTDESYQGKVKLLQIFGTWCPNCKDETLFLIDYFKKNPNPNVEIIGLAFEKHRDPNRAKQTLQRYKDRLGIEYELLLAGYSDKAEAALALPMLNHILAYPTLIYVDKQNKVRKIHTGFEGPATSKYQDFIADFEETVRELAAE